MNKYKVAVYAICKNEEAFVERWVASMKEADEIVVLDTGSTDGTVEKLRALGVKVEVAVFKPWRFDIPRNTSLQMVSSDTDICVCTDLDEVLTPGWRAALEASWVEGRNCRVRYLYTWNFNPDGSPGTTFWYEKIHARNGYRWVKPVHEILECHVDELSVYCEGFQLHHHADTTKSRGSYLPLLEMSVKDEPEDDRNSHYLGREYMYYGKYDLAIAELQRHLSLPRAVWFAERAASMRFISRCYVMKSDYQSAKVWALKACAEDSGAREPWLQLAKIYHDEKNWHGTLYAARQALAIKVRPNHYINEPEAWGGRLEELEADALAYL